MNKAVAKLKIVRSATCAVCRRRGSFSCACAPPAQPQPCQAKEDATKEIAACEGMDKQRVLAEARDGCCLGAPSVKPVRDVLTRALRTLPAG